MSGKSKKENSFKKIAVNRKARHNYNVEDTFEAGIVLYGSEVKSLRGGNANIADAFGHVKNDEVFLNNAYIAEYKGANQFNHYPNRPRKLLLHKQQIRKLIGKLKAKGYTLAPLSIYFNEKGKVKVEMALVSGKSNYDKRETEKKRDWDREKQRLLRKK